tara:strand:+ start:1878 stop:2375 length:498 start_codon:yes stop_codon:yes gene_type:complete
MNILDNYNFSNRARNALKNDGSYTAVKLLMMSDADLLRIPNFGRKSWKEILPIIEEIRKDPGAPTFRDFMIFHKNCVADIQTELRSYQSQVSGLRRALTDENSDENVDDLKNQITDLQGSEADWRRRAERSKEKESYWRMETLNTFWQATAQFTRSIGRMYWKKS